MVTHNPRPLDTTPRRKEGTNMEPKELTQAKRDVISQLLNAHGYTNALELLNGHAFKDGKITRPALDPMAAYLLPILASLHEEVNFQRRMKFVSIDGRPPVRKGPSAHANDQEGPPPELLHLLEAITGIGRRPTLKKGRPQDKQGNLF